MGATALVRQCNAPQHAEPGVGFRRIAVSPMLQDAGPFFGRDVVMTTRIQDLSAKWNVWLLVSAVHAPNPDPNANHISIGP